MSCQSYHLQMIVSAFSKFLSLAGVPFFVLALEAGVDITQMTV